jgi:hypothetical protein
MRPAELLIRVYRLLECESLQSEGDLVKALRQVVGASDDEGLMLIVNEIFIGLIRERAQIPPSALKQSALNNLLRQAVVAACTALDTYLPSLLRENLPILIQVKGREFFPKKQELQEYFQDLTFGLEETLRLTGDPNAPLYIANKILGLTNFKYLSSKKGIYTVGTLLGLENTWADIAEVLQRDKRDLMKLIDTTTGRRNDIVHRADRPRAEPTGAIQEIDYVWAKQAVDTINHVCLALDKLVTQKILELQALED